MIRREQLEAEIARALPESPWAQTARRLMCMRGIDTLTAAGLCAEIGDFARFRHPAQVMSYLGVVPSEQSSGERRRRGPITKSGSRHARRLLVEAAWYYRRPPRVAGSLARRQLDGEPHVLALSWRAQRRLHHVRCLASGSRRVRGKPSACCETLRGKFGGSSISKVWFCREKW
jgi:transposase